MLLSKDFAWPRFVVIQINKSGAISIENEIRKENQKRREFNQHNEIFKAYNENARAFKDQGKYDKALEYYEQSLKECNRIFEEEGPESANIYDNMAMVYNSKGEFAKAVEYNSKALAIWEKYFGAEHASAASTYNNIGSVYKDQGDYEKAMEYYSKALAIREKDFGIDNSTTAASYNNIGSVYEKQGDYNKALEFYSKALAIWEKHLGKDNQTIAQSYNNIGTIYDNQGDYDKALEYFLKALEINEKHLGTEHPDTATSYNNIGSLYDNLGNYDKALEYYFKALAIREKVYGKKQMDTAASYNNIGTVFWRKGDYNLSLQYFYKALSVREDVFGRFHPATAQSYNNIGAVHEYQGDFDKALEYYLKGLEIREKVLGTEHPDTATSYFNTAGVYFRLGDYSTAMDYSNKAYQVFNKVLGPKHPYTELVLSWINEIKNIINKDVQVKENYKNEIIGEKDLGAEEPEKITIDSDVAMVNKEKGDFVIAESNQKEQNTELSIPPFKTVFEPTSKDNFISLLIYHNLLNIINDTWGWKNGFGIVNDWQNRIDNETPVMDQFFSYINSITDEEKSKTLKSLYNIVLEIQNHTSYKSVIQGDGFLYIDCEKSTDNLINLGDRVLSRNKFYLTSKFFDFSYAQTLDSETILSSGEQELLNLFSRFYDSAVLHPAKFSNIQSPSILMLDEAEIGFHPDWQRKYLKLVIDFINALKMIKPDNQDFQIIISTHSPILLSDIPKCCTNYFERIDNLTTKVDKDEIGETFAANVFNLYRMSFFMKDGLVGEFARTRIKELDKRIDSGETEGVMNEIRMIGDDGIREYLLDKYQTKHPIDKQVKEDVIRYYQEKIDQLNEGIK